MQRTHFPLGVLVGLLLGMVLVAGLTWQAAAKSPAPIARTHPSTIAEWQLAEAKAAIRTRIDGELEMPNGLERAVIPPYWSRNVFNGGVYYIIPCQPRNGNNLFAASTAKSPKREPADALADDLIGAEAP